MIRNETMVKIKADINTKFHNIVLYSLLKYKWLLYTNVQSKRKKNALLEMYHK